MNNNQKTTWIQYFQYLHSKWGENFEKSLSLGECSKKYVNDNIIISSLINLFYRYKPFEQEVTNAYKFKINYNDYIDNQFDLTFNQNGADLFTFIGTKDEVISYILTELNSTSDLIALYNNDYIYVYTYDDTYTYSDLPIITIGTDPEDDITITIKTLLKETDEILNTLNCLTLDEMCLIKDKLIYLLKK